MGLNGLFSKFYGKLVAKCGEGYKKKALAWLSFREKCKYFTVHEVVVLLSL